MAAVAASEVASWLSDAVVIDFDGRPPQRLEPQPGMSTPFPSLSRPILSRQLRIRGSKLADGDKLGALPARPVSEKKDTQGSASLEGLHSQY